MKHLKQCPNCQTTMLISGVCVVCYYDGWYKGDTRYKISK